MAGIMSAPTPLQGTELIDCARANAKYGTATAAERCGYGSDQEAFTENLLRACDRIGVEVRALRDLIEQPQRRPQRQGIEVAPDSATEL